MTATDNDWDLAERWLDGGRVDSPKEPGTAIQIVKKDEPALVLAPRELSGGERQFGAATLVPHSSGIAPRGPKILYEKDGVPTYVETLKCSSCGCYFSLTFSDPKTRSTQCATCYHKGKALSSTGVITTPTVVIGPVTKTTAPVSTVSGRTYGSSYTSISPGYRWVPPSTEFDKFFESLASFKTARTADADDSDDSDVAGEKTSEKPKSSKSSGKKKNKRERRQERKERRKHHPHAL